ncbi:MAG: hypothetical protein BWX88_05183 [Planctomycetes bacterium ADurb.Bin126]|nr:MAG: hypothetical protein BWX88_05183 [Planctomycetes bacterium ADurb.Bin126]HOD84964.1 hypothetical protein [Phycisphaerae bacterium]HQL76506.1 hypothetical protein [Phycisphaerae bacterium]
MTECNDQFERVCKGEFQELHVKLDKLDEAIRGNGKPGIQLRLDRLEAAERTRGKLIWLITGSAVSLAGSSLWRVIFGG